jgi:hypothetical protein
MSVPVPPPDFAASTNSIIMFDGMIAAASDPILATARSSTSLSASVAPLWYLPTRSGWPWTSI